MYYTCNDDGMPNQPKTTGRTVRIDDNLWGRTKQLAAETDTTASDVVRQALEDYLPDNSET